MFFLSPNSFQTPPPLYPPSLHCFKIKQKQQQETHTPPKYTHRKIKIKINKPSTNKTKNI